MVQPAPTGGASNAHEAALRDDLASAERAMGGTAPILRQLLRRDAEALFSHEVVARVRGLFADLSRQLVGALAEAAGHVNVQAWARRAHAELAEVLADSAALLAHLHALAVEWQVAERLARQRIVDPALSPLLQARIAETDSAAAAALLAAQTRFAHQVRRMQVPLAELPGDLLHIAVMTMRAYVGDEAGADGYALIAERTLRSRVDERAGRLALLGRMLDALGGEAARALALEDAGVGLFASALARGTGLPREASVILLTPSQRPRLALALRACGLPVPAIAAQFALLHPDSAAPRGLEEITPARAAALLTGDAAAPVAAY